MILHENDPLILSAAEMKLCKFLEIWVCSVIRGGSPIHATFNLALLQLCYSLGGVMDVCGMYNACVSGEAGLRLLVITGLQ